MAKRRKVTSSIVAEEERRTHVINIDGYSRTKELLKAGDCTTSIPFMVGDHNWVVKYYPNGNDKPGCISVYLVLDSAGGEGVKAKVTFSILDKGGEPVPEYIRVAPEHVFPYSGSDWGFRDFIEHEDLEGSVHLGGGSFRIKCDVAVKKIRSEETHANQFVVVPPSNLHRQLGDLLKSKDGADVAFRVGGEIFLAHRSVLAARSSVFKAELFGDMREKSGVPTEIGDIEADVFKSLLHFIYTDSLPETIHEGTDEVATQEYVVTAGHLLVAADRYDIARLKLICEEIMCNHMDSTMVATSLALAEQHNYHGLKEACFEFLASPSNLEAMIASDGYQHLKSSCPSVLKELIAKLLPVELTAAKDIIRALLLQYNPPGHNDG